MTHVLFHGLDKFHPPGQITWQANFREIDEFVIRHGRGRSEFHLITAKTFRSLAHVLAKCFAFEEFYPYSYLGR
jgi:hypothetical protein